VLCLAAQGIRVVDKDLLAMLQVKESGAANMLVDHPVGQQILSRGGIVASPVAASRSIQGGDRRGRKIGLRWCHGHGEPQSAQK